jgi:GNAT superfamily N-acetyltransferase
VNEHRFTTQLCNTPQAISATTSKVGVLLEGLGRNIIKQLGDIELGQSIRIFLRDKDNKVIGGITSDLFGGWMYISLLWVAEPLRNQGLGTELLNQLETEAIRLGCKYAHVDTYSFEARPFYEQAGYEVFGKLDDYPEGHCKFFFKKRLISVRK